MTATALMILGGFLGILFVTVLRRVMVEDQSLPFPESVAAAEIHKAGQRGAEAAKQLFRAMGVGALIKLLGDSGFFSASNDFQVAVGHVQGELRAPRPQGRRAQDRGGRRHDDVRARGDARLLRRRLHHRTRARRAELRGRPARLGPLRPAARLLPRARR